MKKARLSPSIFFHSPLTPPALLLLLLLYSSNVQCKTTTTTPTPLPSQPSPTTAQTAQGGQGATWSDNLANAVKGLLGGQTNPSSGRNVTSSLADLIARLPGIFQGVGGASGTDVGQILAKLFGNPGSQATPAWIDALVKGLNSSQSLQQILQQIPQNLTQPGSGQQLQDLLSRVFPDVLKGLSSLNLTSTSSAQDIVKALLQNPSLMSSLGQFMPGNVSSQQGLQEMLAAALRQQFPVDPSSQCAADLKAMGEGVLQGQLWALKMLDAMGKIPAGILQGSVVLFGDYEECTSISHTTAQSHTIEGLLCGMAVKAPDALATRGANAVGLHLCLPSSCDEGHRYLLIQPTLESIGSQYYGQYCYRQRDPAGDGRFIGVVFLFVFLGALCAVGTFYGAFIDRNTEKRQKYELPNEVNVQSYNNQAYATEAATEAVEKGSDVATSPSNGNAGHINGVKVQPPPYTNVPSIGGSEVYKVNGNQSAPVSDTPVQCEEGLLAKLVLSFSVLRNGRKVLNCDQGSNDVSCLHGIRVLSITWVILGHCFTQITAVQANPASNSMLLRHITYAVFPGALLAVDTFFLLSGFLTAFLFIRSTKKSGLTPGAIVLYYVHRVWRLTPLYALMLAYYIGIFPYTKRGPFENLLGMDSENSCRDYWYYNLLYVNNVIDHKMEKICFGWSWYLSNDMQFSFLAPLILIPWILRGKLKLFGEIVGCFLAFSLIVVHSVTSGVLIRQEEFSMFKDTGKYMEQVYFTPWCRVGPYAVGLLLGFILSKTPRTLKLHPVSVLLGWLAAWAVGLTVVYINYDNLNDLMHGVQWNTDQTAAYEALAKWVWAVCVSWVIFACYTGYGGFINTLLSWGAWAPLSRLTYGVYLIHLVVLSTLAGNFKTALYLDGWTGTELTLAVTVLSYMASFGFSMLIEAPTLGLEKAILGKIFKKKKD